MERRRGRTIKRTGEIANERTPKSICKIAREGPWDEAREGAMSRTGHRARKGL